MNQTSGNLHKRSHKELGKIYVHNFVRRFRDERTFYIRYDFFPISLFSYYNNKVKATLMK